MNEIPLAKANVGLSIQVWAQLVISSELTGLTYVQKGKNSWRFVNTVLNRKGVYTGKNKN